MGRGIFNERAIRYQRQHYQTLYTKMIECTKDELVKWLFRYHINNTPLRLKGIDYTGEWFNSYLNDLIDNAILFLSENECLGPGEVFISSDDEIFIYYSRSQVIERENKPLYFYDRVNINMLLRHGIIEKIGSFTREKKWYELY